MMMNLMRQIHVNIKRVLTALILTLLFPLTSQALTQVTLEWQPVTDPNLAGYRLFCRLEGESYDYTLPAWEGMDLECTIEIPDEVTPCYFVVRAFSIEGNESLDSNEVWFQSFQDDQGAIEESDKTTSDASGGGGGCFVDLVSQLYNFKTTSG